MCVSFGTGQWRVICRSSQQSDLTARRLRGLLFLLRAPPREAASCRDKAWQVTSGRAILKKI